MLTDPHRSKMFRNDTCLVSASSVRERTAIKRASSRANGTRFGRPRKVDDTEDIATAKRMKADGHTGKDIDKYLAQRLGVGTNRAIVGPWPRTRTGENSTT